MNATTRLATESDMPFVDGADRHVSPAELAHLISAGRVMVAEVEGALCGLLRWGLFWDEIPFMNLLWVLPDRRGHGVGTALIQAWEDVHRAAGHQFVLTSTSSAERAQHLYRRLRYVDSGSLLLPGEPAELLLRKSLLE